jgi:uncharacterized protein (TIGR03067 family)
VGEAKVPGQGVKTAAARPPSSRAARFFCQTHEGGAGKNLFDACEGAEDDAEVIPGERGLAMRTLILLAAVLTLSLAPAPLPRRPPRGEGPKLQGEWEVVSWETRIDGIVSGLADSMTARFASDRLEIASEGRVQYKYELTFEAARPARVTLRNVVTRAVTPAIYRLQGETLTLCYRGPGQERPAEFHDKHQWMVVLKRKRS